MSEETLNLTIKTPHRDSALAAVMASTLEAYKVINPGEADKFRAAIDKAEHSQAPEIPKTVSTEDKLTVIKAALGGLVTHSDMPADEKVAFQTALPAKDVVPDKGRA
jgi:hypothetical protein